MIASRDAMGGTQGGASTPNHLAGEGSPDARLSWLDARTRASIYLLSGRHSLSTPTRAPAVEHGAGHNQGTALVHPPGGCLRRNR